VSIVRAEAYVEGGATVVAAHYVADVSNFTVAHKNYEGNGRLKNSDGIFAAWRPADWMIGNPKVKDTFALSSSGVVTVKKGGLYFIYAQVTPNVFVHFWINAQKFIIDFLPSKYE